VKRIIAVNSNCYHGFSISEAIDGIKAAGFHYIELTATKGWTEHVFPTHSFSELVQIKDKLEAAGLIPLAMSGHCNLMDKERIGDFIMNMELAAFFGCEYIVSSIGEAHLKDKAFLSNEEAAANIRELIPYLKKKDLRLVLETHGDHGTGVILKEIVDLIDSELVSINYDTANVIYYGDVNIKEDLQACIEKVGYMHLKDKKGATKEWNFPAVGEGNIDMPMIFDMLEKDNNQCPFSIEIEFTQAGPKNLEEVNRAVKKSYDYLISQGFEI
jgi:L-ribulose-5-phosphate 3-epimerase